MEHENTQSHPKSQPAQPFAQLLVKHGGRLWCPKCGRPTATLPHTCKDWRAR